MQDRVPTPGQEGRVKITPESGDPFYAKLEMADNPTQEGTPLNKANLLTDAVAAMWGGDSSSKVTDILKYAAARYGTCATAAATAAKVVTLSNFVLSVGAVIGVSFTYTNTASSPTLDVNGTGAKAIYFNGAVVGSSQVPKMAYLQYDGTYWQILNAPVVQIATGSYTGTGTYGSENPITISFPFSAKFLLMQYHGSYTDSSRRGGIPCIFSIPAFKHLSKDSGYIDFPDGLSGTIQVIRSSSDSDDSLSVKFHGSAAVQQFNLSGRGYYWVAIG